MAELKTIYHVEGKLCKDFIGQISYTVCLDQKYDELDIKFSFAPQHFRSEDVTPELKQYLPRLCAAHPGWDGKTRWNVQQKEMRDLIRAGKAYDQRQAPKKKHRSHGGEAR